MNWKMTRECPKTFVQQDCSLSAFAKRGLQTLSICSSIIDDGHKHYQFFFRNYYGCEIAGFSIPAAEHRCTF